MFGFFVQCYVVVRDVVKMEVTLTAETWSTRTVDAAAEVEASACTVSGGNEPSDPSLTSTEQDA